MTRLNGTWPTQVATVNPSPPVVVSGSVSPAAPAPSAASAPTANSQTQSTPPNLESVHAAAKQIESYLQSYGRSVQFSIDETTGRAIVSVRDSQTGQLIRQIPDDETLRIAQALAVKPASASLIDLLV